MRRYTLVLATILVAIFLLGIVGGEVNAHPISQGSAPWSPWRVVTWNSDYILVHHRHLYNGTVCEMYDRYGNKIRFLDSRKNIGNRDCTG